MNRNISIRGLVNIGASTVRQKNELQMYVCVKGRPCGIAHGKGQPTRPRGEVHIWIYFPNPASKISSWHTADRLLLLISGIHGQLFSVLPGGLRCHSCLTPLEPARHSVSLFFFSLSFLWIEHATTLYIWRGYGKTGTKNVVRAQCKLPVVTSSEIWAESGETNQGTRTSYVTPISRRDFCHTSHHERFRYSQWQQFLGECRFTFEWKKMQPTIMDEKIRVNEIAWAEFDLNFKKLQMFFSYPAWKYIDIQYNTLKPKYVKILTDSQST